MKRAVFSALCALLLLLSFAACGGSPAASNTSEPIATEAVAGLRIGFSMARGDAFESDIAKRAAEYAKAEGYELLTANAGGDAAKQADDIYELLSSEVKALIVLPVDMDKIVDAVALCRGNGVTVINLMLPANTELETLIAPDYNEMGKKAARLANECVADNSLEKGVVYMLEGSVYGYDMQLLHDGFTAELERLTTGGSLTVEGSRNFEPAEQESLTGFEIDELPQNVNIVFAHSSALARALAGQLESAGRTGVHIITIGGEKDIAQYVAAGTMYATIFTGTDAIAKDAAEQALKAAKTEDYAPPQYIEAKTGVISSSSANAYLTDFNGYAQLKES